MMKELFNSPLWSLAILVLLPAGMFVAKLFRKQNCPYCKMGVIQEVSAIPEGTVHYNQNSSSNSCGGHSTSAVRMKVKYQCSLCKEFFEVQENR